MRAFFFGRLLWAGILGLTAAVAGHAQSADSLRAIPRRLEHARQQAFQQKLFVHLDRPSYLSGETMWFKIYNVDGQQHRPLALETTAYVELLDRNQRPVLQGKIALKKAAGQGSFELPSSLLSGNYTLRAYTSWMRNFSPDFYFHQAVTIINTAKPSASAPKADTTGYDVRFFPEGGHLVNGLSSKVAFKIADPSSHGLAVQGVVLDRSGQPITTFTSHTLGMGNFMLTPQARQAPYTAVVTLPSGRVLRRALPAAQTQGMVMQLTETGPQQLTLTVRANVPTATSVFLLAHARQLTSVASSSSFTDGTATFVIDKTKLAEGITHFTVFDESRRPVCERLFFVPPTQLLTIKAQSSQAQYLGREKVSLQLAASQANVPAAATLSVAVYRADSLAAVSPVTIASYLWLTSELPGLIERPEYYFSATSPEVLEAADNLMLTHGWRRFRWEDILGSAAPKLPYLPELHGLLIRGRVTHKGTNKPAPGITTYLASPSRVVRLSNAVSAADGSVQFAMPDYYANRDIVVQTDTQRDSSYRLEVLDPFSGTFAAYTPPRLFLTERNRPLIGERHFQQQVQAGYAGKNRFIIPTIDSAAFYGQPDEQYLLDDYVRFPVMEEVMREYVPGVKVRSRKGQFSFTVLDNPNRTILTEPPLILLDGVPVFDTNKIMALNPLKVQKLEVLDSRFFQGRTMYSGIVSYTTYGGKLDGYQLDPRALAQEYEGWQLKQEFYAPRYDTAEQQRSRLPDFRNLLYWNPDVATTKTGTTALDFYTSDQAGRYLVVVQGLTAAGAAGSTTYVLDVKQPL